MNVIRHNVVIIIITTTTTTTTISSIIMITQGLGRGDEQTNASVVLELPLIRLSTAGTFGRGDLRDTLGNPHRAQVSQFEFFELVLLLKLDKRLPVERFEAAVLSVNSTLPPSEGYNILYYITRCCTILDYTIIYYTTT